MASASPLGVLVVSGDALARAGLRTMVEGAGFAVEAERSPGDLDAALPSVDAVVLELGASSEPIETVRALAEHAPVLVVLWSEEQARESLAAGARGVLMRDRLREHLAAAVRGVADGLVVVDPAVSEAVLRRAPAETPLVEPLTPREGEVLSLIGEGLGNRAIAARLGISEHTAKFHVNAILGKLGAQTRAEAVAIAARLGLLIL